MTDINKEEIRQKLGNITQIRELLFGDQIEEYNRNFNKLQQENHNLGSKIEDLNLNLERFKSDTKEHLSQLKSTISLEINTAIDSLEKKLKYLSANTYTEVTKLNQTINAKTQSNFQKIELVTHNLSSQIKYLKDENTQDREALEKDLTALKTQLLATIDKNLSELTEAKVSRNDLAEVLFELCLKVKGQDIANNDIEHQDLNGNYNKLLLLEEPNHQ